MHHEQYWLIKITELGFKFFTWGFSSQHPPVIDSYRTVSTGDAQLVRNEWIDGQRGHSSSTVYQNVLKQNKVHRSNVQILTMEKSAEVASGPVNEEEKMGHIAHQRRLLPSNKQALGKNIIIPCVEIQRFYTYWKRLFIQSAFIFFSYVFYLLSYKKGIDHSKNNSNINYSKMHCALFCDSAGEDLNF